MEIIKSVTDTEAQDIRGRLYDYNKQFAGDDNHMPLKLAAKEDGRIIGGLLGGTYWNYLYIEILIVDDQYRGRGIGSKLLNEAESIARARGCRNACLDTHDFQGVDFYKRHGYGIVGELPDLPPGHKKLTLHKRL